jgi:hypothetical protein
MRVERALLEELPEKKFNIGYQGEQNHTQVIISCPIMFRDYPDAVASMVVKPPQGDLYPVSLTRDGNDLTWDVSDADVAIPGEGILQLTFTDGEGEEAEIIKTVYGAYSVNASLVANGEAPDPVQSWLDEAGAALATFENEIGDIRKITTATEEDEGLALSPKTVVNGKVTEWEYIDLADPEVVTQAIDDWLDDHPEATTTVEDGAITEAKLNDSLKADLAWQTDVDGLMSAIKRPEFIVGNAEEVLSDRGETDEAVYLFRKTGGTKKAYNREQVKKLVGGTVAWNQLMNHVDSYTHDGQTLTFSNGVFALSGQPDAVYNNIFYAVPTIVNHKYAMLTRLVKNQNSVGLPYIGWLQQQNRRILLGTSIIFNMESTNGVFGLSGMSTSTDYTGIEFNLNIIDLTSALTPAVADYIYTIETQTAGSGVALFRSMFDKSYYAYNAGSLESVNVSKHLTTGKNQVDKSKIVQGTINASGQDVETTIRLRTNYIPVLGNQSYYVHCDPSTTIADYIFYYDENKSFISLLNASNTKTFITPTNCVYVRMTLYKGTGGSFALSELNAIQLELGTSGTDFEPYQLYEYSMPNVTLRGIQKLVNNEIVFDGDELTPDGTVKRKYAIVTYDGSSDEEWTLQSINSSGIANFQITISPTPSSSTSRAIASNGFEQQATAISNTTTEGFMVNGGTLLYLRIKSTTASDATGLKTWLASNPMTIVYEIATPTTESVDGYQELQVCNRYGTEEYVDRLATAEASPRDVSIPCGHETFYPVNVFDYIDEHLSASQTLMELIVTANREEAMKATKAYTTGNLLIVNGTLYKATTSIANGANLTVGTNVTATTIATELANLA